MYIRGEQRWAGNWTNHSQGWTPHPRLASLPNRSQIHICLEITTWILLYLINTSPLRHIYALDTGHILVDPIVSNEIEENSSFFHTTPQTPSLFFSLTSIIVLWHIDSYILSVVHAVIPSSSPASSLWCYGKAWYGVFDALELTTTHKSLNWQEAK